VYTDNPYGLSTQFVSAAISSAANAWELVTADHIVGSITTSSETASTEYNQENAAFFGDYSDANVIAVTTVWYDRRSRQLLECDIMFDTDWTWGDAMLNPAVMDLQNIATHELGHCFNLADIYDSSQSHLTMYGYSYPGDYEKRTLEAGDIAGIQSLFGAVP
jgi:hypothetical protein